MRKLIGSLLLIFSAGAFGHADDWPTAKVQKVFSENGQYYHSRLSWRWTKALTAIYSTIATSE